MVSVKLNHFYKVYDNGTEAVLDFNMEIKDKYIFAILLL